MIVGYKVDDDSLIKNRRWQSDKEQAMTVCYRAGQNSLIKNLDDGILIKRRP